MAENKWVAAVFHPYKWNFFPLYNFQGPLCINYWNMKKTGTSGILEHKN